MKQVGREESHCVALIYGQKHTQSRSVAIRVHVSESLTGRTLAANPQTYLPYSCKVPAFLLILAQEMKISLWDYAHNLSFLSEEAKYYWSPESLKRTTALQYRSVSSLKWSVAMRESNVEMAATASTPSIRWTRKFEFWMELGDMVKTTKVSLIDSREFSASLR